MSTRWQSTWQHRVRDEEEFVRFVDDVGCCTINLLPRFPTFPSQEVAMGRQDVLGHTWFWKDDLHVDRRVYYIRLFEKRPGFIAPRLLPAFIATNGQVADELIHYGALPAATKEIYEIIERRGPISTKDLKKLLGPDAAKASTSALIDLERRFIITKTAIGGRTMGTYTYIWDLAERWMPDAFAAADRLGEKTARNLILDHLREIGVEVDEGFVTRVLGW